MSFQKEQRSEYAKKLLDPRWQKRRLETLVRDKWTCQACSDTTATLHVHHRWYEKGAEPWDAPPESLVVLCESCHEQEGDSRPGDEADLLKSLKRRYFSFELCQIAKVMATMPHRHTVEVQLTAVAWLLSHPQVIDAMLNSYFERKCPMPGELPPNMLTFDVPEVSP